MRFQGFVRHDPRITHSPCCRLRVIDSRFCALPNLRRHGHDLLNSKMAFYNKRAFHRLHLFLSPLRTGFRHLWFHLLGCRWWLRCINWRPSRHGVTFLPTEFLEGNLWFQVAMHALKVCKQRRHCLSVLTPVIEVSNGTVQINA
jgi:hypothetical protein